MSKTSARPEKTEDGFSIIYDPADIPDFESEAEESAFWDTHTYSEELLDKAQNVPLEGDDVFPPARPRSSVKRPISLRLDEDTLTRLKRLATKKRTNYQTLAKNFINERLYEEEKREGLV
jgi:uncharacterized protein (DUF4415 family)